MNLLPAYHGDGSYVFVCYAHRDQHLVYPEIAWLQAQGVHVWYDEGIQPGSEWTDSLAQAIQKSSTFIYFLTPASINSEHCRRELNFAQDEGRLVLAVHLQPVVLPPGLRLSLNNRQVVMRENFSEADFRRALLTGVSKVDKTAQSSQLTIPTARNQWTAVTLAAVTVLALLAGYFYLKPDGIPAENETERSTAAFKEATHAPPNSVAILPFENLSPDPEHGYFATGIHGSVLNQLAKIGSLSVSSNASVQQFRQSDLSIGEIGRALNVAAILEGNLQYAGDRVRIVVRLIDAAEDRTIWSDTYDRDFADIFAIQSDIALSIANAFQAELTSTEQVAVQSSMTNSPAAYALVLKARDLGWVRRQPAEAIEALNSAVQLDPGFGTAYGMRAELQTIKMVFGWQPKGIDLNHLAILARRDAELADEFGAEGPTAAYVNKFLNLFTFDWQAEIDNSGYGEPEAESSLLPDAYIEEIRNANTDATFLSTLGLHEEAIRISRTLVKRFPMNHILWDQLRLRLQVAGDLRGALEANRESLRQAPTAAGYHLSGAEIALASGLLAEARDSLETSMQLQMEPSSAGFLASRIYLLNRLGMVEQADAAFQDLVERSATFEIGAGDWALANLGIGDRQQMEIWLERAAGLVAAKQTDVGLSSANFIRLNIMRDPVLEEPEYAQLRSRLAPTFAVKRNGTHMKVNQ